MPQARMRGPLADRQPNGCKKPPATCRVLYLSPDGEGFGIAVEDRDDDTVCLANVALVVAGHEFLFRGVALRRDRQTLEYEIGMPYLRYPAMTKTGVQSQRFQPFTPPPCVRDAIREAVATAYRTWLRHQDAPEAAEH